MNNLFDALFPIDSHPRFGRSDDGYYASQYYLGRELHGDPCEHCHAYVQHHRKLLIQRQASPAL